MSSCICYSQITAEMPPSVIVAWWPAEKTENVSRAWQQIARAAFFQTVCVWVGLVFLPLSVLVERVVFASYFTFNGVCICCVR